MPDNATESLDISATGVVRAEGVPYKCHGAILQGGSAAATLVLRSGGASGTVLVRLSTPATDTRSAFTPVSIPFNSGIHATLTGTGATAQVFSHKI